MDVGLGDWVGMEGLIRNKMVELGIFLVVGLEILWRWDLEFLLWDYKFCGGGMRNLRGGGRSGGRVELGIKWWD